MKGDGKGECMMSAICDTREMIVSYNKGMFSVMDKGYPYKHKNCENFTEA